MASLFNLSSDPQDWRKIFRATSTPSDLLFAVDSRFTKENFTGRAVLCPAVDQLDAPFAIDLVIQNIDLTLGEHIQVTEHAAETLGLVSFGKAPLTATISAILIDTPNGYGKQYLMDAWINHLRVTAAARRGQIPVLRFLHGSSVQSWNTLEVDLTRDWEKANLLQGPFLSMRITESSESEDTLTVVMTMFVTAFFVQSKEGSVMFDYTHPVEINQNWVESNLLVKTNQTSANTTTSGDPQITVTNIP